MLKIWRFIPSSIDSQTFPCAEIDHISMIYRRKTSQMGIHNLFGLFQWIFSGLIPINQPGQEPSLWTEETNRSSPALTPSLIILWQSRESSGRSPMNRFPFASAFLPWFKKPSEDFGCEEPEGFQLANRADWHLMKLRIVVVGVFLVLFLLCSYLMLFFVYLWDIKTTVGGQPGAQILKVYPLFASFFFL